MIFLNKKNQTHIFFIFLQLILTVNLKCTLSFFLILIMLHPRNKKKNNGKRGLDDINLKDYNKNLFQDRIHCTPKTCGFNFWVIKIFKYKFWCFTLKLV